MNRQASDLLSFLALAAFIGAILMVTPSAHGEKLKIVPNATFEVARIPACQDSFPDLPRIANRLGVQEWKGGATTVLRMCDGRSWSLIELINALLDRMDKAGAP